MFVHTFVDFLFTYYCILWPFLHVILHLPNESLCVNDKNYPTALFEE